MMYNNNSKQKQQKIDNFLATYAVGETVLVRNGYVQKFSRSPERFDTRGKIVEIKKDHVTVKIENSCMNIPYAEVTKAIYDIGENPFNFFPNKVRNINFSLESILFAVEEKEENAKYKIEGVQVLECNWNPYVYLEDGSKYYYQRDYVWTTKDKQRLIESIYMGTWCGSIIVRCREWNELEKLAKSGETELAFKDIIDGKQRLNAIFGFIRNEYPDNYGNYYGDLSDQAQRRLTDHQLLSYGEMKGVTDKEVLQQFYKTNVAGVPQSEEHLKNVLLNLEKVKK